MSWAVASLRRVSSPTETGSPSDGAPSDHGRTWVDTDGVRISASFAYGGPTDMFERAGFRRVQETASRTGGRRRWVMRMEP